MMTYETELDALHTALEAISSSADLMLFVAQLHQFHDKHSQHWENPTLPGYLEAMSAWLKDWNDHPEQPDWQYMAKTLYAAMIYE